VLRAIAEQSAGGAFLNLARMKPAEAAGRLRAESDWVKVTYDEKEVSGVLPRRVSGSGPVVLSGKLLADEATVTVTTTWSREMVDVRKITLKKKDAGQTGLVARYWAGQRVAELSAMAEKNGDEILALGKGFGLVTPRTSLMVLENVEQYVRYGVVPPKSLPGVYAEFAKRIEEAGRAKGKVEEEKITRVLAMWKGRTAWWEKDFSQVVVKEVAKKGEGNDARNSAPLIRALTDDRLRETGRTPTSSAAAQLQRIADQQMELREEIRALPAGATTGVPGSLAGWTTDTMLEPADGVAGGKTGTRITIKQWDPKTPYVEAMKKAVMKKAYEVFIEQRKIYGGSPAFYLDCADYFLSIKETGTAVRILTDIAELRLESAPLLRIAAYRLMQIGQVDLAMDLFEKAKALRPDEPQSWRDLAQAYAARAERNRLKMDVMDMVPPEMFDALYGDWQKALELYRHVVMNNWDRFPEIEITALMEANALWAKIQEVQKSMGMEGHKQVRNPLDPRLVKNLDCDLRIVMTWDADVTDIDLHVLEPTGEEAFYSNPRTQVGGLVSKDFTQGYGPEEYCIKQARAGKYKISAVYFGSNQQTVSGPVTVQATVITNFGRADEKREAMTLRLVDKKETVAVGEGEMGK
jgi:Ca-activated chloride channel homolog